MMEPDVIYLIGAAVGAAISLGLLALGWAVSARPKPRPRVTPVGAVTLTLVGEAGERRATDEAVARLEAMIRDLDREPARARR